MKMSSSPNHENISAALLLIDVMNDFEFEEGDDMLNATRQAVKALQTLRQQAYDHDIPVIYVNDHFGLWRADFQEVVTYCLSTPRCNESIIRTLQPGSSDYVILKPKHSGFFGTSLDILLDSLNVDTLILTGLSGDICVRFTANDAYMRDYRLWTPSDCIVSNNVAVNQEALQYMERVLDADITPFSQLDMRTFLRRGAEAKQDEK